MAAPAQLLTGFAKVARTTKPDSKRRLTIRDPDSRGLFVRITPAGGRSWVAMARDPDRKQVWATIGDAALMELSEAREKGRDAVQRIKRGESALPPTEPAKEPEPLATFKEVAEDFLKRHVRKERADNKPVDAPLRSAGEIERQLRVYVYPEWGAEPFVDVRRGRVTKLLNKIDDNNGKVMADRVLATLRKLFNWVEVDAIHWAGGDEEYKSPIVRGMRKADAGVRTKKRILTDDELRALWADWSYAGGFGAFLQTCLLTAQRRAKVLTMRWEDVSADGVWTIPAEAREKVNAGTLKLPKLAHDIIKARPIVKDNPYVFAGRGEVPTGNISHDKAALDKRVPTKEPWTIHDLRRTAKSLMARAGVRPDISERTLGHVIPGVEGVYDQHDYAAEKGEALERLAGLVKLIIDPPAQNVVSLRVKS